MTTKKTVAKSWYKDPIIIIGFLAVLCGIIVVAIMPKPQPKNVGVGGDFAGVPIGGAFELVNQNGEIVTDQSYKGQYKFIYFGFTFCPAICPTELQKMTAALSELPKEISERVQPIFITIDPERDTQEIMQAYVPLFHPNLVGLTGTADQIKQAADAYRVYYAKVEDPKYEDYTMDHSSYIYLMSPEGDLMNIYKISDDAEHIATDIKKRFAR